MTDKPGDLAAVGDVVRPHGVRGELVVEPVGPAMAAIEPGATVWVGERRSEVLVEGVRPHRGRWLVQLRGVADREAAEALRGAVLRVPVEALPAPGSDEFYVHDLVGCTVLRADGTRLGEIARVIAGGAHDLMEVAADRRTLLVPMVRDWLREIDLPGRRITVDLPPGLEENASLGG